MSNINYLLLCGALLGACAPAGVGRVSHLLRSGQHLEAVKHAEAHLERAPGCRALRALKIEALVGGGHLSKAAAYYRQLTKAAPDAELLEVLALAALKHGTREPRGELRRHAVLLIRSLEAPVLRTELHRLLRDPIPQVSAAAAAAVITDEREQAISTLRRLLTSADPLARALAARELGRTGALPAETFERLVADPSPAVRMAAAQGLNARRRPDHSLLVELARDGHQEVRWAAVNSLGRLGRGARVTLLRALEDDYLGVRIAAFQGLAPLSREVLLQKLSGADPFLALQAGKALAGVDQGRLSLAALARVQGDPRWTVRAAAINIVGASQLRGVKGIRRLVQRGLGDPHPQVQLLAARVAVATGDLRGGAAAARRLHARACGRGGEPSPPLCQNASELLAQQGQQLGLGTLRRLARGGPTSARISAMAALLRLNPDSSLALEALQQGDPLLALHGARWLYFLAGRPGLF